MPVRYAKPERSETVRTAGDARLERCCGPLGELPILHVHGTPQEMGRQYGALTGDLILLNARRLVGLFTETGLPETLVHLFLDGCWKRLAPHTPPRYLEEMAAIVLGARDAGFELTLQDLQRITAMTNLDMYKREERIPEFLDPEALAALGAEAPELLRALGLDHSMSCTMFAVWGSRTVDGKCFSLRNLDWVSQSGMHEARLVTVYQPEGRNAFVTMGYAGVMGCIAGMNEKGISLSEVGSFSVREELDGTPWIFLARRVLEECDSLEDAVELVQGGKHTIGYNYLIADGDPAHVGTEAFRPRAAAFETNFECCEVFYENDVKEAAATWRDENGEEQAYGLPLTEGVLRADTDFGEKTRALQASDDGPGDPENTGNPCGRNGEGSTYTTCHKPMHDMIRAYETGDEYVFPVRNTKVIEAGAPRKIGPEEALNIAATVAHNVELLPENDWDVMSVVYAPTDLDFWVSYESCDDQGQWLNAPDSGYWQFNLRELIAKDAAVQLNP